MNDRLQEVLTDHVLLDARVDSEQEVDTIQVELALFEPLKRTLQLMHTQFLPWLQLSSVPTDFYSKARTYMSQVGHIYAETKKAYQALTHPSAIQQSWYLFYQAKFTKLFTQASYLIHQRQITSLLLIEPDMDATTRQQLQHISLTQLDHDMLVRRALLGERIPQILQELQERQTHIQQLETDARDIFELFQDLSVLVNGQQEQLDHIELHIRTAKDHVRSAEGELQHAERDQQASSRKKKVCCFVVLALLCIFVGIGFSIVNSM